MAIIKQYRPSTDTTYVYESISYWDPEKKQPRSKRHLIGKLDPETQEIIPTGKRGRKKKNPEAVPADTVPAADFAHAEDKLRELMAEIIDLKSRNSELEKENRKLRETVSKINETVSLCVNLCAPFSKEER